MMVMLTFERTTTFMIAKKNPGIKRHRDQFNNI